MKPISTLQACPCDSGKPYTSCCEPLHLGVHATSALALMRSRYSAYAMGLEQYLIRTWYPDTRPSSLRLKDDNIKWLGLTVLREEHVGPSLAIVEFVARYKVGGNRAERLHEISEFIYTDAWYYVSGQLD
jgi:SEC-C motif domain protein